MAPQEEILGRRAGLMAKVRERNGLSRREMVGEQRWEELTYVPGQVFRRAKGGGSEDGDGV